MRKARKRVLSTLLAAVLALGLMPSFAFATTPASDTGEEVAVSKDPQLTVSETQDEGVATLSAATLPAAENGVITLVEDVTLDEVKRFSESVTLDLNGNSLTVPSLYVTKGAVVTITDNSSDKKGIVTSSESITSAVFSGSTLILDAGTLENTADGGNGVFNMGTLTIKGGTVKGETGVYNTAWNGEDAVNGKIVCNIEGGTVDAKIWGVCVMGPGIQNGDLSTVDNDKLVVNISGGTIIAEQGIAGNASSGTRAGFTVNMTAGEIKDHDGQGTGMYLPSIGVTNISGGSVTAAQAIRICAGTLNVTSGTITCTAVSDDSDLIVGGSGGTLGAIVVGKAGDGYVGDIDVNVSGNAVVKNTAQREDPNGVYPTIVVSDKNMAQDKDQCIKDPATGKNTEKTFNYSETTTSVVVNAEILGDIVKISNVTQNEETQDGGNTSLEITGGTVTGNVINQTTEGNLNVTGATVAGNVKNGSAGSVTISKATVTGSVSNASTGDVLINEDSQVSGNVSNGSGSVAIVNSAVTGTAYGNATIVNSTVGGIPSNTEFGANVALVGGETYANLQAAIDNAKNGDTVTLLKDVTLDGSGKDNTQGILTIDGKNIVLDGNGNTITAKNVTVSGTSGTSGPSMINIQNGANVTVKNLTINGKEVGENATDKTKHGLNVYQATVTVENVTIENGNGYGIVVNGSTAIINGLVTKGNGWGGINVDSKSAAAKLTINNATVWEDNSVKIENSLNNGNPSGNQDPVTEIKGGSFQYVTVGESITNKYNLELTISGGKFATDATDDVEGVLDIDDYVADGLEWNPVTGAVEKPAPPVVTKPSYDVTVDQPANGAVELSAKTAKEGQKVTVTVTPDLGWELAQLTVADEDGDALELTENADGTYSFTMPAGDVTVHASFADAWENPFTDLSEDHWGYGAVRTANLLGLMKGIGGTTLFGPDDGLLREQAATVMWNLMGAGDVSRPEAPQADVDQSQWYAPYVNWAVDSKVMDGYSEDDFGVGDSLTREQFAAVVAKAVGADVDSADQAALGAFPDADGVSGWARATMAWAVEAGVLNGVGTEDGSRELQATRELTRAEMATMMVNAIEVGVLDFGA